MAKVYNAFAAKGLTFSSANRLQPHDNVLSLRWAELLIKFVPPETLERFGGAGRYARAMDDSLTRLGALLREPASTPGCCSGRGVVDAATRHPVLGCRRILSSAA
jgi:hypothetical protein